MVVVNFTDLISRKDAKPDGRKDAKKTLTLRLCESLRLCVKSNLTTSYPMKYAVFLLRILCVIGFDLIFFCKGKVYHKPQDRN